MGKSETKPLAVKNKMHDLEVKYNGLLNNARTFCPDCVSIFEEIIKDLSELDKIFKERNRY